MRKELKATQGKKAKVKSTKVIKTKDYNDFCDEIKKYSIFIPR